MNTTDKLAAEREELIQRLYVESQDNPDDDRYKAALLLEAEANPAPEPLTDELVAAAENLLHEVGFGRIIFDTTASERMRAAIAASKKGGAA